MFVHSSSNGSSLTVVAGIPIILTVVESAKAHSLRFSSIQRLKKIAPSTLFLSDIMLCLNTSTISAAENTQLAVQERQKERNVTILLRYPGLVLVNGVCHD